MDIRKIIKVWSIFLLAVTVSLAWFALVYTLQHPEMLVNLATIGWNGYLTL